MPEVTTPNQYVDQIPRFRLPKEFSNEPSEPVTPATPAAPPPPEAKPEAEAASTETETLATETETEGAPEKVTTEKDPEKQSTRRFERRIDRIIRREAQALARAESLERENAELKAKIAPAQPKGAPKLEDFSDIEEYAKAYGAFEKENALKEYQQKQTEEASKTAQARLAQSWEAKAARGISKYDDFEEVVGDIRPNSPMAIAVIEAENGEDIAHYLGTHIKEVQRILALSPGAQFREIGKLEAKLAMKPETPKQPSKAPAPITPVAGGGSVSNDEIKPQMPFEEYLKVRKKALGRP